MFHESSNNKIYICPSTPIGICRWEGEASSIIEHFETKHKDLLIKSNSIQVDVTQEIEQNKLMVYKNETFLVQTKVSLENTKLSIRLRLLGKLDEIANMGYTVEILSNQFGFTNENCPDGYSPVYNVENGIEVDIKAIYLMSSSSLQSLTIKFNIIKKNDEKNEENFREETQSFLLIDKGDEIQNYIKEDDNYEEETLKCPLEIKCTNCKINMIPPILMCSCGHNVCWNCRMNRCLLCAQNITNSRNADLEEYCKTIEYPCRYEHQGCREKYKYDQIRMHEILCTFCTYKCGFCGYDGKLIEIKGHFKIAHPSVKIYETMIGLNFPRGSSFIIINNGGVFYCTSLASESELYVEWKVSYYGPKERAFNCEVRLFGKKQQRHLKSYFLKRGGNFFQFSVTFDELRRLNVKDKYSMLYITSDYF